MNEKSKQRLTGRLCWCKLKQVKHGAEQSRAEQSRAEQSRATRVIALRSSGLGESIGWLI